MQAKPREEVGAGSWRRATESHDDVLVELCRELYLEDPGSFPADARPMRKTLTTLRREPWRGCAVVLVLAQRVVGYALLIAYWSNELGGEVCAVDELFVARDFRGRGHGSALFDEIERGGLWARPPAAVALGTTPGNSRARRLYERLGFAEVGVSMVKKPGRRDADDRECGGLVPAPAPGTPRGPQARAPRSGQGRRRAT